MTGSGVPVTVDVAAAPVPAVPVGPGPGDAAVDDPAALAPGSSRWPGVRRVLLPAGCPAGSPAAGLPVAMLLVWAAAGAQVSRTQLEAALTGRDPGALAAVLAAGGGVETLLETLEARTGVPVATVDGGEVGPLVRAGAVAAAGAVFTARVPTDPAAAAVLEYVAGAPAPAEVGTWGDLTGTGPASVVGVPGGWDDPVAGRSGRSVLLLPSGSPGAGRWVVAVAASCRWPLGAGPGDVDAVLADAVGLGLRLASADVTGHGA